MQLERFEINTGRELCVYMRRAKAVFPPVSELRVNFLSAAAAEHPDHVFITSANVLTQEPQRATGIHTQLSDQINAQNVCVSDATFKNI